MSNVLKYLFRIVSAILVFVVPFIIIFKNFGGTTVIETTQSNMPLFFLILMTIFGVVVIAMLFSQIIIHLWENIKKNPIGFISTLSFGIILLIIVLISKQWLYKLQTNIETNAPVLIDNITLYTKTLVQITWSIIIGFALGLVGYIIELQIKKDY